MPSLRLKIADFLELVDAPALKGVPGLEVLTGLDYASTDKKYNLRTIPGESFSGLEMMCLMHAGFRRLAPDMETGMDLDEPYLVALEMFELEKGREA